MEDGILESSKDDLEEKMVEISVEGASSRWENESPSTIDLQVKLRSNVSRATNQLEKFLVENGQNEVVERLKRLSDAFVERTQSLTSESMGQAEVLGSLVVLYSQWMDEVSKVSGVNSTALMGEIHGMLFSDMLTREVEDVPDLQTQLELKRQMRDVEDKNDLVGLEDQVSESGPTERTGGTWKKYLAKKFNGKWVRKLLPFTVWYKRCTRKTLLDDLIAGLSCGIMMIAQCMAYALLAGLPPAYGLYSVFLAPLFYAPLGTALQNHVGPIAVVSLLLGQLFDKHGAVDVDQRIMLAKDYAFVSGVILLLFGFFRLGFIVNFLSKPVLNGYVSAAAVIIFVSQLQYFFGITISSSPLLHIQLRDLFSNMHKANGWAFFLGIVSFTVLVVFKKVKRLQKIPRTNIPFPYIIVVVVVAMSIGAIARIDSTAKVAIVGKIPRGLPHARAPEFANVLAFMGDVFVILLAGMMESIAIGKVLADKDGTYEIDKHQEFVAIGAVNFLGSFFSFYPSYGAIGRSIVNYNAGAKTPVSSIVSAVVIFFTLLVLTPLFYYLPLAVLASVVMVAAMGLIDYETPIYLWRVSKKETVLLLLAFFLTLFLGVEVGVLVAIAGSLVHVIYFASQPHTALLGRLPGTNVYRNIAKFPEAEVYPGIAVFRFDGPLFFGNIDKFKRKITRIEKMARTSDVGLRGIIIDANPINNVDFTAVSVLRDMITEHSNKGITICFAGMKGKAFNNMSRGSLVKMLGENHFFFSVHDAVQAILQMKVSCEIATLPEENLLTVVKSSAKELVQRGKTTML